MQKITIIVGLPGSGKTTYIENNKNNFKNAVICDDYHKSSYNHSHNFEDSVYYEDLKRTLKSGEDAVLSDIAWCKTERREILEKNIKNILEDIKINAEIIFIYFENNPEACKKNVLKRNRNGRMEREMQFIDEVSAQYTIPDNAIIIPIIF
ncbi:MAG: AAA family ATPase [Minisyncoccia bacterium]